MTESNQTTLGKSTPLIILLACVGAAVVLLVVFARFDPRGNEARQSDKLPGVGKALANLRLQPLVGPGQPLGLKDLQGKVVLINFWGTWCGPCHMEMPHLVELHERWRDNANFMFVSVSCGDSMDSEKIDELRAETADYLNGKGYDLHVHTDPQGITRRALIETAEMRDQGFIYPMTVLLDRQGVIRHMWPGYAPGIENEMQHAIEKQFAKLGS